MSRFQSKTLCRVGILAAMYVPLALFVGIQFGNVRLSFGSLPVVVGALLYGPLEAALVALVGELLKQLLTYGLTATTVLYLIPPMLRGLVIGAGAVWMWRRGKRLENCRTRCFAVCILAAVCTTIGNTLVNWLDSVLYGYYTFAYVFGDAVYRFGVGMLNAVVVATVAIPLAVLLRLCGRLPQCMQRIWGWRSRFGMICWMCAGMRPPSASLSAPTPRRAR